MNFEAGEFNQNKEKKPKDEKVEGGETVSRSKLQNALRAAIIAATAITSTAGTARAETAERVPPIMGRVFSGDVKSKIFEQAIQMQMYMKYTSLVLNDAIGTAQKLSAKDVEKYKNVVLGLAVNDRTLKKIDSGLREAIHIPEYSDTMQPEAAKSAAPEGALVEQLTEALRSLEDVKTSMRMEIIVVVAQKDNTTVDRQAVSEKVVDAYRSLENIEKNLTLLLEDVKKKVKDVSRIIEPRKKGGR